MTSIIPQKRCCTCKKHFPATNEYWHKNKREPDGLAIRCKSCKKIMARATYERHREKILKQTAEYNRAHPELRHEIQARYYQRHIDTERERHRNYYAQNKEHVRGTKRKWRETHRLQHRACQHAWRVKNRRRVLEIKRLRRERLAESLENFTEADALLQLKTQGGKCWWCGKELQDYHIDHIIPVSRDGTNAANNIVIACPPCNLEKGSKLPWEWLGRLI